MCKQLYLRICDSISFSTTPAHAAKLTCRQRVKINAFECSLRETHASIAHPTSSWFNFEISCDELLVCCNRVQIYNSPLSASSSASLLLSDKATIWFICVTTERQQWPSLSITVTYDYRIYFDSPSLLSVWLRTVDGSCYVLFCNVFGSHSHNSI